MRWFGRAEAPAAFRWFVADGDAGVPTARFSVEWNTVLYKHDISQDGPSGLGTFVPTLGPVRSIGGRDPRQRFHRQLYWSVPQQLMASRFGPVIAPVPAVKIGHVARRPKTRQHGSLRRGGRGTVRWPRAQIIYPNFPRG